MQVSIVDAIQSTTLLEGRFSGMRVANFDLARGSRQGSLSVVFSATDEATGKKVALKFYDPSPATTGNEYRSAAFVRESEILKSIIGKERCLQLHKGLSIYPLRVASAGGTLELPCRYFTVEWLEEDIEKYFLMHSKDGAPDTLPAARAKLEIFREIVLAIQSLHQSEIFHRDIKQDNLRMAQRSLRRLVVAIDLGTAALLESGQLVEEYGISVGARGYAAPEARCGLAGNRRVAQATDRYALGCLLFEMFNKDYFFIALRLANPELDLRLAIMAQGITERRDQIKQQKQWDQQLNDFASGVTPVRIRTEGSTVPPGISSLLDELLAALTAFAYPHRMVSYEWILGRLASAIKVLSHEAAYQKKLEQVRERRRRRVERVLRMDSRSATQKLIGAG